MIDTISAFYPISTSNTPPPPPGKMLVQYFRFDKQFLGKVVSSLAGYCDKITKAPPGSYVYQFISSDIIEIHGTHCIRVTDLNFDFSQLTGFEDWREWVIATGGKP
jgi:hypothetical protein